MATRAQNERDFPNWDELSNAGRRYWIDKIGRVSGFARYVKIVDANEMTQSIVQEIYDQNGKLIARHQKYPVDTGHQVIE
ncbi:MAG TPA: hypothetical protein VHD90_25740 [Phototrophicaceae bacterium]|nr:hypothetical protein [Phototrophicaceae bacterium]